MAKYLNNGEEFPEIINQDKVLIDFYADWCGPCKMLGPVLDNINIIPIVEVNVDTFPSLAQEYKIMSIPALLLFEKGKLVHQEVGFHNQDELEKMINNY